MNAILPYNHLDDEAFYEAISEIQLRWIPTKKLKSRGKIKKMRVWFHSRKASGVNPA